MNNSNFEQMEAEACAFYCDAFCGESARIVHPSENRNFKIAGVVEIETGDKRGTIYVASVHKITEDLKDG